MLKLFEFFDNYLHYNFFIPMICAALNIILLFYDIGLFMIGGLSYIFVGFDDTSIGNISIDYIYAAIYIISSGLTLILTMTARGIYSTEKINAYRGIMLAAYICLAISYALMAVSMIYWVLMSWVMMFLFIIPALICIFIFNNGIKIRY